MNFLTYNVFDLGRSRPIYENGMFNADKPVLNKLQTKSAKYDIDKDTENIKRNASGYISI